MRGLARMPCQLLGAGRLPVGLGLIPKRSPFWASLGLCLLCRIWANFIEWFSNPKNRLRSPTSWGSAMSTIAWTFEGSFLTPSPSRIWKKYCSLLWENINFSRLSLSLLSTSLKNLLESVITFGVVFLHDQHLSRTVLYPYSSGMFKGWRYSKLETLEHVSAEEWDKST